MTGATADQPPSRTAASEAVVRAALDASGRLVDDSYARSFWILVDAEGNEVCVCTWTDRDGRD